MYVIAWRSAAITRGLICLRGRAPVRSLRIEGFENQAAVVTEQFVHADYSQEEDGVVVVALNPFAFASWTLHAVHSSRLRALIVRGVLSSPCTAQSKTISSIHQQAQQQQSKFLLSVFSFG